VLGHRRCGAVSAAAEALEKGHTLPGEIATLVDSLKGAVEAGRGFPGDRLENAVRVNVERVVYQLQSSPVLSGPYQAGKVEIVGMFYDLDSGLVELIKP
jgi:carbonic anhydrase